MGLGAKGCAQRRLFHAHTRGVRPLCAPAVCRALSDRSIVPRARPDVEADAGDSALRAFSSGLLAARKVFREAHASCPREDSAACAGRSLLHSHFAGPALRQSINGPVTVRMATEQRGCELCCLPLADVLAGAAGPFLSSAQRSTATLAGSFGQCLSHCGQRVGNSLEKRTTLHFNWLVLVCRHAGARDWLGAGRRASARDSRPFPATDRPVCADCLERRESDSAHYDA